jgi:hypothetical protein
MKKLICLLFLFLASCAIDERRVQSAIELGIVNAHPTIIGGLNGWKWGIFVSYKTGWFECTETEINDMMKKTSNTVILNFCNESIAKIRMAESNNALPLSNYKL